MLVMHIKYGICYTTYMNEDKNTKHIHDHGFVRLIDSMGDDNRIVQSARVSYGAGTKSFREDRGLIRYLLRNVHTSPFEQVVFTFHIKMPIFVARQWTRHRTARLNEISARYSVMSDEWYIPADEDINKQSVDNKQGRDECILPREETEEIKSVITGIYNEAYDKYQQLIEKGLAREIARIILPTALYTEMYWQIDLHNLFHFLKLRLDAHAQREIRVYAEALYELIQTVCPVACEAFEDYILNKVAFSHTEKRMLQKLLQQTDSEFITNINSEQESPLPKRELEEFINKVQSL